MTNNKAYNQDYYKKNKTKRILNTKLWRQNNPEKNKLQRDKWLEKNPNYYKDKMKTYRPRANEVARNWRKNRPDKAKDTYYKYNYGITLEQYNQLFVDQNGVCAICKRSCKNGRTLYVDHDHETGTNRGLLCDMCNFALGHFDDNIESLLEAIKYLERYK